MTPRTGRLPWNEQPHIVDRVLRVWESYLEGISPVAIAEEQKVAYITVWRDIQRGKQLYLSQGVDKIAALVEMAVIARESIQEAAFRDRRKALVVDAAGKAALLRVISDNQTAIEELQHIRGKNGIPQIPGFTYIQVGPGSPPQKIQDLTDEQLAKFKESLLLPQGEVVDSTAIELPIEGQSE
jgi:hypothetical protein